MIFASLFLLPFALSLFPAQVEAAISIVRVDPIEITSENQEIKLFVTATNLSAGTQYLQAAFTKVGQANYFGYTQNSLGNWIKYDSSPDLPILLPFEPLSGEWNGEVNAKIDPADSGFTGSGDYLVKLLKYISTTGTSSNSVPVTVKLETTPIVESAPEETKKPASIEFSFPANLVVGQEFEIPVSLLNFEKGDFFVKARIGKDSSQLSKGQTFNGDWLKDTDSWSKFPTISSNGKITARLSPNSEPGEHKIRISVKSAEGSPIQSEEKLVSFKDNPKTQVSESESVPKTKAPVLSPKASGVVLSLATQKISTMDEAIDEHYKKIDLLATNSAIKKNELPKKKFLNLLISQENRDKFPLFELSISIGTILVAGGAFWFLHQKH